MVKESRKGGPRKHSGVNERSCSLGFHWKPWLLDGSGMCHLKSYSCRSRGVDENLTSYIGYSSRVNTGCSA